MMIKFSLFTIIACALDDLGRNERVSSQAQYIYTHQERRPMMSNEISLYVSLSEWMIIHGTPLTLLGTSEMNINQLTQVIIRNALICH